MNSSSMVKAGTLDRAKHYVEVEDKIKKLPYLRSKALAKNKWHLLAIDLNW